MACGGCGEGPLTASVTLRRSSTVLPVAAFVFLVALGALGAWAGGAPIMRPALRVGFWSALGGDRRADRQGRSALPNLALN
jgi:hypothetical protein